jgi:hypothetical protein
MALVRKGGFEPPRLSAPPPQDGVSASSTTSALESRTCVPMREGCLYRRPGYPILRSIIFIHAEWCGFKLSQ